MLLSGGVSTEGRHIFPSSITPRHYKAEARVRSLKWLPRPSSFRPVTSVATGEPKISDHKSRYADQFRLGGFSEDGLSYKEKFIVRSYEVGVNKTITIQIIVGFLQDVACNHFLSGGYSTDGFSTTHAMRKRKLIMVVSRLHIEVYKYPEWNDVVEIETWFQIDGRIGFRRDWILRDYSTGEVIGRATSKLLLMNEETRRFHQVVDDIRDEILVYTPKSPRLAFSDENKPWKKKIEKLDDPAHYFKPGLQPRRGDLDMNRHVNNATYIGWILESIPSVIVCDHELQSLTIDYKRECQRDDIIDALTSAEYDKACRHHPTINGCTPYTEDVNDFLQFRHLVRLSENGAETNRAITIWRKITRGNYTRGRSLSKYSTIV